MLKKYFIFFLLLFLSITHSYSQKVIEQVNFDTYVNPSDNDLVNHFYGMQWLIQTPGGGITGGELQTPDSNNWGNDNSRYCSKYKSIVDSTYLTSICFFYDASLISTGFDRAVSIWMQPHTDPNHYIIASVSHQRKIEIFTYFSFDASQVSMNLINNNWYKLKLGFSYSSNPIPNNVSFFTTVENLGPNGLAAPVLVDSVAGTIQDSILAADDAIELSLTGARFGGTSGLDNFRFEGIKSADSCNFTNIDSNKSIDKLFAFTDNGSLRLRGRYLKGKQLDIFDSNGKKTLTYGQLSEDNLFDISGFHSGIYFITTFDTKERLNGKFLVN